jgi:hypothetical protein
VKRLQDWQSNEHNRQPYIQVVYLLDNSLPVFYFHRAFAIRHDDNLARPRLLVAKKNVLRLNSDD